MNKHSVVNNPNGAYDLLANLGGTCDLLALISLVVWHLRPNFHLGVALPLYKLQLRNFLHRTCSCHVTQQHLKLIFPQGGAYDLLPFTRRFDL